MPKTKANKVTRPCRVEFTIKINRGRSIISETTCVADIETRTGRQKLANHLIEAAGIIASQD